MIEKLEAIAPSEGGAGCEPCTGCGYLPLHQPSTVLWLYHVRPSLPWFSFSGTPCLGHCLAVSSALCPLWALRHWLASSTCRLTLTKSTPRNVTITSCTCSIAFSVILTCASGTGAVV